MAMSLKSLIELAKQLIERALPIRAFTLKVYSALSDADMRVIEEGQPIESRRLSEIATTVGTTPVALKMLFFDRTLRNDTQDESSWYHEALSIYEHGKYSAEEIRQFLERQPGPSAIHFILHGIHMVWDPSCDKLSEFRIEPEFKVGGESEKDDFPMAVEGYLVSKRRAFDNTVSLCSVAFSEQWAKWQSLWSNY